MGGNPTGMFYSHKAAINSLHEQLEFETKLPKLIENQKSLKKNLIKKINTPPKKLATCKSTHLGNAVLNTAFLQAYYMDMTSLFFLQPIPQQDLSLDLPPKQICQKMKHMNCYITLSKISQPFYQNHL